MFMRNTATINRRLNILNLFISIIVVGTGLILFSKFHIGDGAYRKEWLGFGKEIWLTIHQVSAIGFLIGYAIHIQLHWRYIKMVAKKWRMNLPKKIKTTTCEQILFLIVSLIVMWAGFYPWITMPGATLENKIFHNWIDVHNRVGILFLFGIGVHIIRRWQQIYTSRRRYDASKCNSIREPISQEPNYITKEN